MVAWPTCSAHARLVGGAWLRGQHVLHMVGMRCMSVWPICAAHGWQEVDWWHGWPEAHYCAANMHCAHASRMRGRRCMFAWPTCTPWSFCSCSEKVLSAVQGYFCWPAPVLLAGRGKQEVKTKHRGGFRVNLGSEQTR
eukprot:1146856-Pelagomonas_calceolata.AAC.5